MAGGKRGPNAKQVAGREKKAENEARKKAELDKKREAAESEAWKQGANTRKANRDEAAALKSDEAARKRQEKAAMLAAEEEANAGAGKPKGAKLKAGGGKKKGKAKNDLSLLEDALVKDADKKSKKKREEALKKQQANTKKAAAAASSDAAAADPLMQNTQQMIGDSNDEDVGRQANVARMQEQGASGIDAALGSLDVSAGPKKSAKALYNEFEARMMPTVKEDYPGLRLTQYKEKVWALWKKSPENPANQEAPAS